MISLLFICVVCIFVVNRILRDENVPSRARISILKKFISFWIAIFLILFYQSSGHNSSFNLSPKPELIRYLEADGNLTNRSNHVANLQAQQSSKKSVIFITTTDYSVTQTAVLTRLGQALYPVRDKVKWIIVLLPLESSAENEQVVNNASNITFGEAMEMREDLYRSHMKSLKSLLMRFGTPFVLLRSYDERELNTSWNGFKWPKFEDRVSKGYQVGLLWALRSLSRGVLMFGDGHFVYNSEIFSELQDTRIAAVWPIGLNSKRDVSAVATPVITIETDVDGAKVTKLIGHTNGETLWLDSLQIHRGAFAVDLEYLRTHVPYKSHWKLCFDGIYNNSDLKVEMKDVQVMGKKGTEIYVWRTRTQSMAWPRSHSFKIAKDFTKQMTNIPTLLENLLGPRFPLTDELVVVDNDHKDYLEYDLEKDIKVYL